MTHVPAAITRAAPVRGMKRNRKDARDVGIGKRMRRRRIRACRARQALERELAAPRADRLAMLAKLCGTLECGHFTDEQLRNAHAALMQRSPDSPQGALPLQGQGDAQS